MAKKSVVIKNEVLESIVAKVSTMKSSLNKVRFQLGVKADGDGLASIATIVQGGCMAEIGFKTSLPKGEEVEIPQGEVWAKFVVGAETFASYVGGLLEYKSDVTLTIESDSSVLFSVGNSIKVTVKTVDESSAEPKLQKDYKDAKCKILADGTFLTGLSKAGYTASDNSVKSGLTDRVFLQFENNVCKAYSTSGKAVAKALLPVKMEASNIAAATSDTAVDIAVLGNFFKSYAATLETEKQKELFAEVSAIKNDPTALLAKAKELGFGTIGLSFPMSLTVANYNLLRKLFAGAEKLQMILTDKNLHVSCGYIKAVFALAGETTSTFLNTIDSWEKNEWVTKVVVDKDALLRNLNLLKLGESAPVRYRITKSGLRFEKGDVEAHTAITDKTGEEKAMTGAFDIALFKAAIDNLSAGNVVIRYLNERTPLSITNGDLTESNIRAYHYVIGVNTKSPDKDTAAPEAEEKKETETANGSEV